MALYQLPILLLGCGGVGQQFIHHVLSNKALHESLGISLNIFGIADSSALIFSSDSSKGLSDASLSSLVEYKKTGNRLHSFENAGCQVAPNPSHEVLLNLLQKGIVVDCTSEATEMFLVKAINEGACVVLANKKPITADMGSFLSLTKDSRKFRNESTVGAALPIMTTLTRLKNSGDNVKKIMGALSGTLGYVMSGLEEGRLFSEVVKAAKALGYTEPDPRDDLSGMDVGRKALIMARSLGFEHEIEDIKIEGLYPEAMSQDKMNVLEFLEKGLPLLDEDMRLRCKDSTTRGNVLRYVATVEEKSVIVGLAEVSKESPLGRLRGSDNLVEILTRCYNPSPLVISGAGAGNDTTAAGVLSDVLDLRDLYQA